MSHFNNNVKFKTTIIMAQPIEYLESDVKQFYDIMLYIKENRKTAEQLESIEASYRYIVECTQLLNRAQELHDRVTLLSN